MDLPNQYDGSPPRGPKPDPSPRDLEKHRPGLPFQRELETEIGQKGELVVWVAACFIGAASPTFGVVFEGKPKPEYGCVEVGITTPNKMPASHSGGFP